MPERQKGTNRMQKKNDVPDQIALSVDNKLRPITIDFDAPDLCGGVIVDGNHRFVAAVLCQYRTIEYDEPNKTKETS